MMNCPLDLFVKQKIYEQHTEFRALQFKSLYAMDNDNLNAVQIVDKSQYIAPELKAANRLLCMISSYFLEKHYHCSNMMHFVRNISTNSDKKYTLKSYSGKMFSGYELLAYYYAGWAQVYPENVLNLNLPYHAAYSYAKEMYELKKKRKH